MLRYWAERLYPNDWQRTDYATRSRREIVRRFFRDRPSATVLDACDAIDGGCLQPLSWHTARELRWMLGDYFDRFRIEGAAARERLAARERERAREREQAEINEGAAAVIPIRKQRVIAPDAATLEANREIWRAAGLCS